MATGTSILSWASSQATTADRSNSGCTSVPPAGPGKSACRRRQHATAARPTRAIRATSASSTQSRPGTTGSSAASWERQPAGAANTARQPTRGRTTGSRATSSAEYNGTVVTPPCRFKTSANVPAVGQGIDTGKKIAGRKRHIGVDTVGLLLAVLVTAASVSDNAGGIHLLSNIARRPPRVTKAWADTGYRTKVIDHGATLGIDVEVTRRNPAQKGASR